MEIKKEQEEQVVNMGAFDYDAGRVANMLDVDKIEVVKELKNKDSKLSKLIQKGKDMADYVIDLKLFEMAKTGDIKALDKLENRIWLRSQK